MIDALKSAFAGVWNSLVRTFIPIAVSGIVGWLALTGADLDPDVEGAISTLLGVLAGTLYYLIIRVVERFVPKFSLLLGSVKQPVYVVPAAVTPVEKTVAVANAIDKDAHGE